MPSPPNFHRSLARTPSVDVTANPFLAQSAAAKQAEAAAKLMKDEAAASRKAKMKNRSARMWQEAARKTREQKLLNANKARVQEYEQQLEVEMAAKDAARVKAEAEAAKVAEAARVKAEAEAREKQNAEAAEKARKEAEAKAKEEQRAADQKRREEERIKMIAEAEAEAEKTAVIAKIRQTYEDLVKEAKTLGINVPKPKQSVWKSDPAQLQAMNTDIQRKIDRKRAAKAAAEAAAKQREERIALSQKLFAEQKKAQAERAKMMKEEEASRKKADEEAAAKALANGAKRPAPTAASAASSSSRPAWMKSTEAEAEDIDLDAEEVEFKFEAKEVNIDELERWRAVYEDFEDDFGMVPTGKLSGLCNAIGLAFQYGQLQDMKKYCSVGDSFDFEEFGKMVDYIRSAEEIAAVELQQRKVNMLTGAKKNEELADMKRREEERLLRRKASQTFSASADMFGTIEKEAKEEVVKPLRKKKSKSLLDELLADNSAIDQWTPQKAKVAISVADLPNAAKMGDADEVLHLIYNGANVVGEFGAAKSTPLHWAAWSGDVECLKILLNNGADINCQNRHGYSPLHWASIRGNMKALNFLVAEGADLQIKDSQGGSPLHWAVSGEQDKCIHALLEAGANINAMNNRGETALHFAATEMDGLVPIIEVLIHAGADWKIESKYPRPQQLQASVAEVSEETPVTALQAAEALGKMKAIIKLQEYTNNPPISERERGELSRTAMYKREARVPLAKQKQKNREKLMERTKKEVAAELEKQYKKYRKGVGDDHVESKLEQTQREEREYLYWMKQERANLNLLA